MAGKNVNSSGRSDKQIATLLNLRDEASHGPSSEGRSSTYRENWAQLGPSLDRRYKEMNPPLAYSALPSGRTPGSAVPPGVSPSISDLARLGQGTTTDERSRQSAPDTPPVRSQQQAPGSSPKRAGR